MPKFDEAQLATMYQADAEEDQALAGAGMAEYMHELCREDIS